MLTPIDNLPTGAIGFVANGRITSSDQRGVFEPTMSRALATTERVKLLYVAGRDFTGYENGGLYDEAVFGTDEGPFNRAVRAMKGLVPAAVRIFAPREIAAAKAWLDS